MSDNNDDYISNSEEDHRLEHSEVSNSSSDVYFEYHYYSSKALKEHEPQAALIKLQKVLEAGDKGVWGFKALKQMIKINFKLRNFTEMMERYKQLLTYINSAVTRNHFEKSIDSISDYISASRNMKLLQNCYEITLEALEAIKDSKNDWLWFKTKTKLSKLYYERGCFNQLANINNPNRAKLSNSPIKVARKKRAKKVSIKPRNQRKTTRK